MFWYIAKIFSKLESRENRFFMGWTPIYFWSPVHNYFSRILRPQMQSYNNKLRQQRYQGNFGDNDKKRHNDSLLAGAKPE